MVLMWDFIFFNNIDQTFILPLYTQTYMKTSIVQLGQLRVLRSFLKTLRQVHECSKCRSSPKKICWHSFFFVHKSMIYVSNKRLYVTTIQLILRLEILCMPYVFAIVAYEYFDYLVWWVTYGGTWVINGESIYVYENVVDGP